MLRDRLAAAILTLATVLGIWVGLTAPDSSPVQPPVTAVVADPAVGGIGTTP